MTRQSAECLAAPVFCLAIADTSQAAGRQINVLLAPAVPDARGDAFHAFRFARFSATVGKSISNSLIKRVSCLKEICNSRTTSALDMPTLR